MEVEVADIADVLDVVEEEGDDTAFEIKEIKAEVSNKSCQRQVAGEGFSREAPDDNLFVGGRHRFENLLGFWSARLSHVGLRGGEKPETCSVVKSLMLCYTYVLCLHVMILLNNYLIYLNLSIWFGRT